MRIPTLSVDKLWHIGDLDITRKYACGESQEGNLFSVSRCPRAWQQIVKLGGFDLYEANAGYTLLDMLDITHAQTQAGRHLQAEIRRWGYQQGLLQKETLYQGQYYDDELEDTCLISLTEDEASIAEAEGEYECVLKKDVDAATSKLRDIHHLRSNHLGDAFDFAVIEWARTHVAHEVDGVYWDQHYNPDCYCAPRAGLFEAKIDRLTKCESFPDNEEELIHLGKRKWIHISLEAFPKV